MTMVIRQATAIDVGIGAFVDQTDGFTAETALTITQPDVRLKKNGGNWAQKAAAQTLTHEENGWYELTLDATDTDTVGQLIVAIAESGARPVARTFQVVEEAIYDALFAASAVGGLTVASVSGAVASVTGAVASVTGNVGGNVTGSVGSLATQAKADVNAEVLDVLNVDTFAQPGQSTPAATTSIRLMVAWLYKAFRNKSTQTATQYSLFNDDAVTVDVKGTFADDTVTATRGELITGP